MKVAVTGGAGFIGSHLARHLLLAGHEVVVVDDLSAGNESNIPPGAVLLQLDLAEESSASRLPVDVDVIFHLAGQASSERSMADPANDVRRNTLATARTLAWARHAQVSRFIFSSTMGVYRDGLGRAAREFDDVAPKSVYGVSKLSCEQLIWCMPEVARVSTVLRFFNVYGPGQDLDNLAQGMVSIFLAQMQGDAPVFVKGPLERVRDFVYIDDVVSALIASLLPEAIGRTLNVATGRATTVEQLLQIMFDSWPGGHLAGITLGARTPADIDSCYGNADLITSVLGWSCEVPLEEGISRTISAMEDS